MSKHSSPGTARDLATGGRDSGGSALLRIAAFPRRRVGLLLGALLAVLGSGCARRALRPVVTRERVAIQSTLDSVPPSERFRGVEGLHCNECHAKRPQSTRARAINFSHAGHLTRGGHCQSCHPYSGREPHGMPTHAQCFTCHDGQRAPQECRLCHREMARIRPASHAEPDFARAHGKADIAACGKCHEQSFCDNCHGLPMPHPQAFSGAPHAQAAKMNASLCAKCHPQPFCDSCHGLPIPHPQGFLRQHGALGLQRPQLCPKCHDRKGFCDACHQRSKPASHNAAWPKAHGQQVKKEGGAGCRGCHRDSYCAACHGLPMPHPGNFIQQHGKLAIAQSGTCAKCHDSGFCGRCHAKMKPPSHTANFRKTHASYAKGRETLCALCHGQNSCRRCHGLTMPHPASFVTLHGKQGASFARGAVCFRCHAGAFCGKCHPGRVPGSAAGGGAAAPPTKKGGQS